ncbi:MAG: pilus assembly protein PilM [Phycisphaerae bacterium]
MVLLMRRRRTRTQIGLDVGGKGVRAVQLTRVGDRYSVSSAALSERTVDDLSESERADRLGRRIQGCVRQEQFHGRHVAAMLNPPAVEFHALDLPPAVLKDANADATQVVRWEVGRLMNEPLDAVETRHWALPVTPVPAPNAIGVATRHDSITQMIEACGHAGLVCRSVDTGATALSRLGKLLNAWGCDQVWGVLDVGCHHARLVLCVGDVPVLVRHAGSGGHIWTERIADSLQVSVKTAEVHKRDHGIAMTGRGVRHPNADRLESRSHTIAPSRELASILLGVVRGELKDLASEVKRSYEYVLSCYPNRHAADLVLVGGGAVMRNLPEFLSSALGIKVRRASDYLDNESCRLDYASGKQRQLEVLASAIGLAVGT